MYRGHEGVRQVVRELDEAFTELEVEHSEVRDLGEQVIAIGRFRARGKGSGAEVESALGTVVDFKNGKLVQIRTYLDPNDALEAAGLSE